MRRTSKKRAKLIRDMAKPRSSYKAEFLVCQCCNRRQATDLHEIARGAHREAAYSKPCTWLVLCRWCHNELGDFAAWPLTRQLALKLVADPSRFDLPLFNKIRGRAEGAITLADVAKHLDWK